jgi:hypothetical protein
MNNTAEKSLSFTIDNLSSRWVTVDLDNKKISEAPTPEEAIRLAKDITKDFILVFVPIDGATYIL